MKNGRPFFLGLAAIALAVTSGVCFWGCKQSSSAPVVTGSAVPPPPVLHVLTAPGDPLVANPLTDPLWKHAVWSNLGAPLQETRTTPPTRAASFYTPTCLYVAFICEDHYARWPNETSAAAPAKGQDRVEVWLDTSTAQNGTEVFAIRVAPDAAVGRAWYRSAAAPQPKEDGSPDFAMPVSQIPDYQLPGLEVKTERGEFEGKPAWATVVAIPVQNLPGPLRVLSKDMKQGAHWRVNLLRSDLIRAAAEGAGGDDDVRQANLSPVYPECQQVSPYRMAEMLLEGPNSSVALTAGN